MAYGLHGKTVFGDPDFFENSVVVHICDTPLLISMVAEASVNVGQLLDLSPELIRVLEVFTRLRPLC